MPLTASVSTTSNPAHNPTKKLVSSEQFQLFQSHLLELTFTPQSHPSHQVLAASYINLFFDQKHPERFKCPDWFGVIGVDQRHHKPYLRTSYVTWQEQLNPFIVIEFLDAETATEDLVKTPEGLDDVPTKWDVYEQILRIPYYIVFDAEIHQLEAFQLIESRYEQLDLTEKQIWIPELEFGLGLWQGDYHGIERHWLRWRDAHGNWMNIPNNQHPTHSHLPERIQQHKQRKKHRELGNRLSERLKNLQLKPTFI
ncbi:MAG: Uma2 family endonuclease [Cyanobacteriota bacterium]|nr:Uma2 family endonuclease [Cyanobacteriota bacterium]